MSYIRVGAIYAISTTQHQYRRCVLLGSRRTLHVSLIDAQHCSASRHSSARSLNTLRTKLRRTKFAALSSAKDDADPGHWEYSPEWWGTHAGGWGRDAGRTLFAQHSHYGNGEVRHCRLVRFNLCKDRDIQAAVFRSQSLRTWLPLHLAQVSWSNSGGY